MGSVYLSIHPVLALKYKQEYNLNTFIETGLCLGESVLWAHSVGFENIFSIERGDEYYELFKNTHSNIPATIIHGDSSVELAKLLQLVTDRGLIWLDAHHAELTPIRDEMKALNECSVDHVVMVDDVRLFGYFPIWPSQEEVREALASGGRRVVSEIDDVFVALPV